MSDDKNQVTQTQHAFLIAWGHFAKTMGLIKALEQVKLKQKQYYHSPQTKVIEFLVAILAGLPHLKDISQAAHPLDQDQAVASAWGQAAWADYSGVSRTLQSLSQAEAEQLIEVLESFSQPFLDAEVNLALLQNQALVFDGDLTGLAVSSTSTTYPEAQFGHMDDAIRLGYQAALVSLVSPSYGRLWLAVEHHPGDTVACTQAEALVRAAEGRIGLRPRRRSEVLHSRIVGLSEQIKTIEQHLKEQQAQRVKAQTRLTQAQQAAQHGQQHLAQLEQAYQDCSRAERPYSQLAKARQQGQVAQRKQTRAQQHLVWTQQRLTKIQAKLAQKMAEWQSLQARLAQLEQDNATNPRPIRAIFRLDAGFGTYENLAFLIEMGYELYTKPFSHQVVKHLKQKVTSQSPWTRVGANAEMITWSQVRLKQLPYPVDIALERFYTGKTRKHSALLYYGPDPVTADLPGWFTFYNARQTMEAGIKEGKLVFQLHHLKVRSAVAIYLQETMVLFAANFIRWATHSLITQPATLPETVLSSTPFGSKQLVQVAAHTSAEVIQDSVGYLLKFTEHSLFAGKLLRLGYWAHQLSLPYFKNYSFEPFLMNSPPVAQNLG
jgi:hypothetical protein